MRITATIALCLLAFSAWGQSSTPVRILDTMADLVARKAIKDETAQVKNRSASILWSAPRTFVAFSTSVVTNAHDGTHYVTNAASGSIYVSNDRFADQQDVRWFGASPEDSTDDTAAVQAAVDHAGGRLEVFLSPPSFQAPLVQAGTYLLDAVTISAPGARIAGSSPASTSLTYPSTVAPYGTNFAIITGTDTGVFSNRLNGFTIRNITFSGEDTRANGLWVNGGSYWGTVENCAFLKFTGIGTLVGGNTNLPVSLVEFQNCKWQNTDGASTASLYIKQSTEYPTGFVTAINLHSCHLDEANADAGSYTMIVDSVGVSASGGTYFDLNNGGQGLRFDKSESPLPTLSGSFVLDANTSGIVAEETYGASSARIGLLFPGGDYLIDGKVKIAGQTNDHSGRGWVSYQTVVDYPYVLGTLALQNASQTNNFEWNQDHRFYVNDTDFVWTSVDKNLYALTYGSVVARTLGNSNTLFSLDVQSTPTPTNAAFRVGGGSALYSYFTGQGYLGIGYANPVAAAAINGGLSVGANTDPGSGVVSANVGLVVSARGALTPSSTAPVRSVNHTYTDLSSTAIAHQFSLSGDVAADFTGGNLYNTYFTTRTGSGTNYFPGLFGVQSDLTINGDFVANARAYTAQLNHATTNDVGTVTLFRASAPSYTSTGRPTNLFGVYIDTMSGGRSANWALYAVGGQSYFGDSVTIAPTKGITLGGVTQTNWPSGGTVAWGDITGKPTFGDLSLEDWPASDGQEYVAKNGAWAVATGGGSGTVVSTNITDSTAAGRALLTAVDAAAQRTSLGLGTSAVLNVAASGDAASGEVVKGDDTRLTDARTPTSHSHDAGAITSGVLAVARIGTGTPHGSNFLRGDGQFAQVTTNDIPGLVAALAAGGGGGTTNLVSSSESGLAPQATLANGFLGTDGSTNVAWRSFTFDAGRSTVTNTVTETTIFEEILPANTLDADFQALSFDVHGIVKNDVGSAQSYRVRFYVNGTVVYNSITPTFNSLSANRIFWMNGRWTRTSSTTLELAGTHTLNGGSAPTTGTGALGASAAVPFAPFAAFNASSDWSQPVTNRMTVELSAASSALWADLKWRIYR